MRSLRDLGGLHRNTFINSPRVFWMGCFAVESNTSAYGVSRDRSPDAKDTSKSAAVGLMAGRMIRRFRDTGAQEMACAAFEHHGNGCDYFNHITGGADAETFQPMNVNFGLFPPYDETELKKLKGKDKGRNRKKLYTDRAKTDFTAWMQSALQKAA
jgi:methylenetetrahydrofolate--tRNA-(uracil-5-)-methyltransferase